MQIVKQFESKLLEESVFGELVKYKVGTNSCLSIPLLKINGDNTLFAILTPQAYEQERPFRAVIDAEGDCLSYGTDWQLELVETAQTFPGGLNDEIAGVIYVDAQGVYLRLDRQPNNARSEGMLLNLSTLKPSRSDYFRCSPVTHWRIWGAGVDRLNPANKPIFEFNLQPAA